MRMSPRVQSSIGGVTAAVRRDQQRLGRWLPPGAGVLNMPFGPVVATPAEHAVTLAA